MVVSDIEAVCRSEAQRVLFYLRGNRKHGSLSRGWRQLDPSSPVRQLCEWRSSPEAAASALLEPLLEIVRSPEFAGPATYVALEAARAVILALCEEAAGNDASAGAGAAGGAGGVGRSAEGAGQALARQLVQVSRAVCECVFEETHPQMDEATTMQMISLLGICTSAPAGADVAIFTVGDRMGAASKVLALWGHYRNSPALRSCAQEAMQRMLDFACVRLDAQADFVRLLLERISSEIGPALPAERALLYLRCIERFVLHPTARRWAMTDSSQAHFFHTDTPLLLMSIGEHFSTSISVLSMLLPVLNRICWLCVDYWSGGSSSGAAALPSAEAEAASSGHGALASLGSLQIEALICAVYLRAMRRAAEPLQAPEGSKPGLSVQEGTELLVVLLEALSDLLQVDTVRAIWLSFDADWRRPPLLQQMIQCIVDLFRDLSHMGERPLPASVVHLSTTVLGRIVSAFLVPTASGAISPDGSKSEALSRLKEQWRQREATLQLMAKIEDSPKKARAAMEAVGLLDFVQLPASMKAGACKTSGAAGGDAAAEDGDAAAASGEHEEWALKLAWVFRCLNHYIPYAAVGEFFGQPKPDSEKVFQAFVETFDCGNSDLDEALRCFLQAFLLPKEAQQIDRVLKMFAHTYYRKHLEHCSTQGRGAHYLKHQDAAYTLAFSVILLNSDQHNPKVKRRMAVENFVRNNRGINEGEDIPEDVQVRIFESVRENEIKTPSSGSLCDGISAARWNDFMQLIRIGYRDNALTVAMDDFAAHLLGFLECSGERVRLALESALAADAAANSDALQGLEQLLHLTLDCPEADSVAEGLFFFGAEAFHEAQQRASVGRASACLQVLFRTSSLWLTRMSTKQLHMLVYLTVQFALYGLIERALPPVDAATARLLRAPSLVVDPPTGVVYSFLRKISTAPFKMLSFTEEGEEAGGAGARAPAPAPAVPRSAPASVRGPSPGSPGGGSPGNSSAYSGGPQSMPAASPRREPIIKEDEAGVPLLSGAEKAPEPGGQAAAPGVAVQAAAAAPLGGGAEAESPRGDRAPPEDAGGTTTPRAAAAAALVLTSPRLLVPGSATDEASLHNDPLRPQIEKVFEMSELEGFIRGLVAVWSPASTTAEGSAAPGEGGIDASTAEASRAFLGYLSSVFLALRKPEGAKVPKDQDLPWWPEPPVWPGLTAPQGLLLPKRALSLNILDGYETLRLALRLALATLGNAPGNDQLAPLWDGQAVQELSVCAHVGIFYTLRRTDLGERTLRMGIVGLFQMASILLLLRTPDGYPISVGWPVRLIEVLVRRADGEPTLLVPMTKVCLEAVRTFITEVSRSRALDQLELWRLLLQLLLKAAPTKARALWPGAKDREVEGVQYQLWRQGILWVLGHPGLLDCLSMDGAVAAERGGAATAGAGASASATFWAQALAELAALAQEIAAGNRSVSAKLLLDAYRVLLSSISNVQSPEDYEQEEAGKEQAAAEEEGSSSRPLQTISGHEEGGAPPPTTTAPGSPCRPELREQAAALDARRLAARSESWARVAIALLTYIGPAIGRVAPEGTENEPLSLLKQTMLNVGVPSLLGTTTHGPYWARLVLEKVVSMLTGPATSGAPLLIVRDAVSLVAKFFLQNLQTLQRHDCFGQLWLMVLRLMLLFIKRGTDDKDVELEEIATETLRNLLWVLLSTHILGFVTPKGTTVAGVPEEHSGPQVWWQMTWDCIEVFLPGFGDEFSRSFPPADAAQAPQVTEEGAGRPPATPPVAPADEAPGGPEAGGSAGVTPAVAEEEQAPAKPVAPPEPLPTSAACRAAEAAASPSSASAEPPLVVEGGPTEASQAEHVQREELGGLPEVPQLGGVQEASQPEHVQREELGDLPEVPQLGGVQEMAAHLGPAIEPLREEAPPGDVKDNLPTPHAAQVEPVPVEDLAGRVAEVGQPDAAQAGGPSTWF